MTASPALRNMPYTIQSPAQPLYGNTTRPERKATFVNFQSYDVNPNDASRSIASGLHSHGLEIDSQGCTWQEAIAEVQASRLRAIPEGMDLDFEPEA